MWIPHWLRKAPPTPDAQLSLGLMYAKGQRVPQDKALYWYRKAVTQGNAKAQYLAWVYAKGHRIPQHKALYWYRKAVAQGNAKAQYNLGAMYDLGQGVPQDDAKAASWYRKAAVQGNAKAQYNLGAMYYFGQGVSQDYIQAAIWLILAKAGGVEQANKGLSLLELEMTPAQITEAQRLANQWWKAHHKQ
jgi:TPR repeat protein